MGLTEHLVVYITGFISFGGYWMIGVLMIFESMVLPIPSEAVLPFAGFLVTDGTFSFWGVLLASVVGSIVGSLLSYAIGMYGGRAALHKWGKYLLLDEHHLEITERFFQKYGEPTIFISRFIPVVRHLISVPAGMAEMNLWKFSLFTILGAGMWNAILIYTGMALEKNWNTLGKYTHYLDIIIVLAIVGAIGYFFYKLRKSR